MGTTGNDSFKLRKPTNQPNKHIICTVAMCVYAPSTENDWALLIHEEIIMKKKEKKMHSETWYLWAKIVCLTPEQLKRLFFGEHEEKEEIVMHGVRMHRVKKFEHLWAFKDLQNGLWMHEKDIQIRTIIRIKFRRKETKLMKKEENYKVINEFISCFSYEIWYFILFYFSSWWWAWADI